MTNRRPLVAATLAAALLLLSATAASAHVEPDVEEVPTGTATTVTFTPEHDCEGSPTVRMEIKLPEGVTGAKAVDKTGWTGSVADGVVTYEWGGTDGSIEGGFGVTFTPPDAVGETLRFPTIQTCSEGEIDWIQTSEDDDRPAPSVVIVQGTEPATTTTAATETTEGPDAAPTTGADATSEPADAAGSDEASDEAEPESDSNPWLLGVGVLVIIAGVGTVVVVRRRRSS